ncbi:MAG: tetratricopeptide repeat protein [Chloroflexi bacterium]|nr:tetratricopeptide repeat protein [Chloroflexota bacterium]
MLRNKTFIIFVILLGLILGANFFMRLEQKHPPISRKAAIPETGTGDMLQLSEQYRREGDLEKSESFARMALKDPASPEKKVFVMFSLGETLKQEGKFDEASAMLAQGVSEGKKILGPDNPALATAIYTMGQVYQSGLKYDKAAECYERALKIREKALGDNSDTAMVAEQLATIYRETGKYDKAEKNYLKAIGILKKNVIENYSALSADYNHLSELYSQMGRYDIAEAACKKALEIDRLYNEDDGLSVVRDLNDLASFRLSAERIQEAEPFLNEGKKILEKMPGKTRGTSEYALLSFENHLFTFYMLMARPDRASAMKEIELVKYWLERRHGMIKSDLEDNTVMFGMTLSALKEIGKDMSGNRALSSEFEKQHKMMAEAIKKGDFKAAAGSLEQIIKLSRPVMVKDNKK